MTHDKLLMIAPCAADLCPAPIPFCRATNLGEVDLDPGG
jgi:hypothetical protein